MPIVRQYADTDVLTEAKRRIHHIFDLHDRVVVAFSGGKDSLVALHLVREIAEERCELPVHAVFRDEEVIPQAVIDFVASHRELDWLRLRWLAVPLQSQMLVLGSVISYVQWDPGREHIRPMPEWAETTSDVGLSEDAVLSEFDTDSLIVAPFKGRVAIITGVRAAESLVRYRSCVNKLNENYLVKSGSKRAMLAKPIYDWHENDVFRFFYDREITYCQFYERQLWGKQRFRVATPINQEASKVFHSYRAVDHDLYERVIEVFPQMRVQERYWRELAHVKHDEAATYAEVRDWINGHLDSPYRETALKNLRSAQAMESTDPGGYPPSYCLHHFKSGTGAKRMFQPVPRKERSKGRWSEHTPPVSDPPDTVETP